ncbi:serine hydrolase [Fodinibius salsisoli]|uniref:beta-lactamase n=1 Tax=Fodinibius salsisoli TaxID=2820877 RepID=A0ABT3PRS0_9BACT|nr:serine hydrolase [Fodinibius salsisoli]MCW9708546.1 serine hydrolase [Fodinibius salsisoli]
MTVRNLIAALVGLVIFSSCAESDSVITNAQLAQEIQVRLDSLEGTFAVAFKNLDDSTETVYINEREMFHAASTMKTPVMVELFKQAEEGKFSLDDSVVVTNEFRSIVDSSIYQMDISSDSEGELYDAIGQKRTIRQLIDDMITMSSNLATNILIEKAGAQNVTQTMRSYGADSIRVLRGVEDIKAYEQGLSNRTTAFDEAVIYEHLGRGEAVSKEASQAMIDILKNQHFNEMIPARLPEEVVVAHKTGWITGVNHDVGLIILPDGGRYVLVLLSKEAPAREQVLSAFADISRLVYDYIKL